LQNFLAFPEGVGLDLNKLAINGHSFGGITCIGSAVKDRRIKVCLPMDPWFFPYTDKIEELVLPPNLPILSIITDSFHDKYPVGHLNKQFF
jgi:platelet-activating factor acetylhydrolase